MQQQIWYVRKCSVFQLLSDEQLRALESVARMRSFRRNSAIYLPSDAADNVFLLAEGRIRICSITPEGKQAILAFIEPGELFGELALVEPGTREERAEAASDSIVLLLPGSELRRMMESSATLTLGITKLIWFRKTRVERRLRSLLFRSNRERLTHLLLELVEQYGRQMNEGVLIDIKLSHQELASIIGATRETVTVLLGEMQVEGLLKVSRQRIIVRDLSRLAQHSDAFAPKATRSSRSHPDEQQSPLESHQHRADATRLKNQ